MTTTPRSSENGPRVTYGGVVYPAEEIARGAAYELFSVEEAPGFEWAPRPGTPPWRRFVHATEVTAVRPPVEHDDEADAPLLVPLHRERGWSYVQQLSQQPTAAGDPTLAAVRASAVVRRGTRMVKVLTARQLAGYVRGWLPHGFCHREHDVAHLRTPAATTVLRTDGTDGHDDADVTYALRWRAADPGDYDVPVGEAYRGLTGLAPRDRLGGAVLGTGFVPSSGQLVPEFVTRDFADLPMPANATLLAYPADGVEVVLYGYQAEQRGWLRMAGPQWRHLLAAVPGLSPDQEYVPTGEAPRSTRLVGGYAGGEYEAVADPPGGFRVLASTRAARYPVEWAARRLRLADWRGVSCLVLREESGWLRLRLRRPDPDAVAETGAQCQERGVYETWAPGAEVTDDRVVDLPYQL
ncbi:hypothetical protein [Micromonospora sp. CPCC 205561]|uniref:hypothetical protein n=1 Tax=Micromonospora sp. CPCC 205561 TaxID=3122407 RepID=UPI002FF25067